MTVTAASQQMELYKFWLHLGVADVMSWFNKNYGIARSYSKLQH